MKYSLLTLIFFTLLSGCSTKVYRQAGSDNISVPFPQNKAIVVIDARAEVHGELGKHGGTMLIGFAQLDPQKSQHEHYLSPEWEFATYPGAIIPGYASEDPHELQAYLLKPGKYAVIRCVFEAPEADYCPAGYWTQNGKHVGIAYFEVFAGDVINTGQLNVIRTRDFRGSSYMVTIVNNQSEAENYISNNWPSIIDKLKYKPIQFTY